MNADPCPTPVFRHRQNECHKLPDGREVWASRSLAVVATVVARVGAVEYVAILERGLAMPDEVGKLALPGGYLDWDETTFDAARREVFEEIGLDVAAWRHAREPWRIHDDPTGKQNVTLHYYFLRTLDTLPPLTFEHADPREISRALWMPLDEAMGLELAFGHQHVLRAFRALETGDAIAERG